MTIYPIFDHSATEELRTSLGRSHRSDDYAVRDPLMGLAGLLDHESPPWIPGYLPPLSQWLYFLPRERQSRLNSDGHPRHSSLLPAAPLPRRMWVGSRVTFLAPIPIGVAMQRCSTVIRVNLKQGRSGPLVFVTVSHEISVGAQTAITEEQDLVFRSAVPADEVTAASSPSDEATRAADSTRMFVPDPVNLFRFSALTYNAHRIHYDRDYARNVEGYPGLVVHGPLVATLLMDHFLRHSPVAVVREFSFRAQRPLFDTAPIELCLAVRSGGADLWARDVGGALAFEATVLC